MTDIDVTKRGTGYAVENEETGDTRYVLPAGDAGWGVHGADGQLLQCPDGGPALGYGTAAEAQRKAFGGDDGSA